MPPIRRSNRVRKPKVHWENPPPTRRQPPPAIIIYTDPSEDLSPEDLVMQPPEDLDSEPEDLDSEPEDLDLKPAEDPDTEPVEDQSYQPQFLPTNRTGRSQNLSENTELVKLFQLFFSVKEMKNIVK